MAIIYCFDNQVSFGIDRYALADNTDKKWKYIRFGTMKNKVIILLSGFLGSYQLWEDLIHEFLPDYCLILLRHPLAHDLKDFREGVRSIMANEGMIDNMGNLYQDPPHIIAHSVGGRVALDLVNQNPERFGRIILFNSMTPKVSIRHLGLYWLSVIIPFLGFKQRIIKREIISRCCDGFDPHTRVLKEELNRLNGIITQEEVTSRLSWLIDEIYINEVENAERFLFIDFEKDPLKKRWMKRNLKEIYQNGRFATLPGKGHFAFFTHFQELKDRLTLHLERADDILKMT
jgi:pimeloyl-ACP methyl ester carboxylesterase